MPGALEILMSKGKPSKDEMPKDEEMDESKDMPDDEGKESGLEDEFLSDAFHALKSDDQEAFADAMKSAIKACYGSEEK